MSVYATACNTTRRSANNLIGRRIWRPIGRRKILMMRFLGAAGLAVSARAGAARLSFHLYNNEDDVERAVAALTP